ncbi:Rpn family recombination-promoting nuclease/putative transposase [Clostridium magnum]|uniref:Putative transposase, YhgA-like n=1 Tax=Clostridium magnum DSM 2767 TaxID=1121326 RepID=A0A161W074_9CLOT|nr:Rpn family recombination-promoting nuclease/putative transposase [Clostridium magnum]KZL88470.1 putative transposase, YhgA-like [Clostridium magnum DSM 2767]SHI90222.1 Putative transposase, YhgA-like [Clostridium magnum DSM 2767]
MLRYNYNLAPNIDFIKEEDEKNYLEHDVGYKYIFSHKPTFIELLRSFVKKDWVNLINEKDLVLLDKSYILPDFKEEESDIVCRVNIEEIGEKQLLRRLKKSIFILRKITLEQFIIFHCKL